MKTKFNFIVLILLVCSINILADGLLMPSDTSYPGNFLRNRITEVSVKINGMIAETIVYQEFLNEWNKPVNAVYSFPLPDDARSTLLLYTRNDTTFRAVLKVQQQVPNPGTGEGGIAALVNKYIGRNGLKMELDDIPAGGVQKIELHYISLLKMHKGKYTYSYPLDTRDFVTHSIDNLEFNIEVNSNSDISSFNIPSHPDFQTLVNEKNNVVLRMRKPKAFLTTDFVFTYQTENDVMSMDAYSVKSDTMDSHFVLFFRPENTAITPVFNKNIVFLLSLSNSMTGYKLEQSVNAISEALDHLTENDSFNIITMSYYAYKWQNLLMPATSENIAAARTFLETIPSGIYGSRLDLGLQEALNQFQGDQNSNSILAFTDGRSPLDPLQIKSLNLFRTGIFTIGFGDDLDRQRLEMTAMLNYGFATYFKTDDNIKEGILEIFEKISQPLIKSTIAVFNKMDVYAQVPEVLPTVFAGSSFFIAGRYQEPGTTSINLSGTGVTDTVNMYFNVSLSQNTADPKFPEYIWAKEVMDALERKIEIYGATPAMKDSLINLSLRYNMRCRYTAYVADYETVYPTDVEYEEMSIIPGSYIFSNYPNPFNPSTKIVFYIDAATEGKVILIKIYNLLGQLIKVIDISSLKQGWHEILFDGKGLSSGFYIVSMEINNRPVSSHKIILSK